MPCSPSNSLANSKSRYSQPTQFRYIPEEGCIPLQMLLAARFVLFDPFLAVGTSESRSRSWLKVKGKNMVVRKELIWYINHKLNYRTIKRSRYIIMNCFFLQNVQRYDFLKKYTIKKSSYSRCDNLWITHCKWMLSMLGFLWSCVENNISYMHEFNIL